MNSDVLDVAHYAEISFVPKSYQGTVAASGDSTIQVSGVFTLHVFARPYGSHADPHRRNISHGQDSFQVHTSNGA